MCSQKLSQKSLQYQLQSQNLRVTDSILPPATHLGTLTAFPLVGHYELIVNYKIKPIQTVLGLAIKIVRYQVSMSLISEARGF